MISNEVESVWRYLPAIFITTILISHTAYAESVQTTNSSIPQWIKNNAKWWSDGAIGDSDFVKGIQYLVQNSVIKVPPLPGGYLQNSK